MNDDMVDIDLGPGQHTRVHRDKAFTQEEFLTLLRERFGDSPYDWAFVCPNCGDVATGGDFKAALEEYPKTNRSGNPVTASDILGQQCIGRTLGALTKSGKYTGRGCDWAAGGLFSGPCYVHIEDGDKPAWVPCFAMAPKKPI